MYHYWYQVKILFGPSPGLDLSQYYNIGTGTGLGKNFGTITQCIKIIKHTAIH